MKKYTILPLILILILTFTLQAQDRKIAIGDFLEIVVIGHQEMTRTVQVNPQGMINFPFVQNLPVKGLTLEQLRKVIASQLGRYLEEFPIVTISFSTVNTIAVNVLGYVRNPGLFPIPQHSTLQGAIQQAGGILPGAKTTNVSLIRERSGNTTNNTYNLEKFLQDGDLTQNPTLIDGDMIIMTGNPVATDVKILGSINQPGSYDPIYGGNLMDMIFKAGGFTEDADLSKIRYISPALESSSELKINMNNYYKNPEAVPLPLVKAGDIIVVPKKQTSIFRHALTVVQAVAPFMQMLYYYYLIKRIN